MTISLNEKQQLVERNLRALKKSHVTVTEIYTAAELDITRNGFYFRIRDLPKDEQPEAHGAFMAGGAMIFTLESGIDWMQHHLAYWHQRQAAKGLK